MNNLENLVPPLELCREIPEGAFADSALVWEMQDDETWWEVVLRSGASGEPAYPAPTLAEILAKIPSDKLADFYITPTDKRTYKIDMVTNDAAAEIANGDNPATAALKLWFDVKGRG